MIRTVSLRLTACLALSFAVSCTTPDLGPGLDTCTNDGGDCQLPLSPGVITGTVVYNGSRRGDAILFLWSQDALPPPDGTSTTPVALARVAQADLFGAGTTGPFSAPYTFTQVPPGHYQIRAFLDATHEFDPFFDYTAQPRSGDPAGGHGAFIGPDGLARFGDINVPIATVVPGISVGIGPELPFDPPSFVLAPGTATTLAQSIDRPQLLTLKATNLGVPLASFANGHFGVELDLGLDGKARSTGGDGLVDVYPKVFLKQLDAILEDNSVAAVAPGDLAVVPGRVIALPILPLLVPGGNPVPVDTLQVYLEPFAVRLAGLGPLSTIPRGHYQVVVIEKSGQGWTLPNSLGSDSTKPNYLPSQAALFTVDRQTGGPDGVISGQVSYLASGGGAPPAPGNIIVQVYKDDPLNPPPPLGAQQPVRIQILRPAPGEATPTGFVVNYRIVGLTAPGRYVVQALADQDGNFSGNNLLGTPTKGDIVGAHLDKSTGAVAPVPIDHGETPNIDVTLVQVVPLDPPAFQIDHTSGAPSFAATSRSVARFGLVTRPLAFPAGAVATPVFTVSLVRNSGQKPVDRDGDGLLDVWPRVFLARLDPKDPTGLTQSSPPVIIPAAVDPTPFLPQLLAQDPGAAPLLVTRVTVIARPVALDVTNPDAPVRQLGVPPGQYKIVVINKTGQIWQIPNEAGPAALDSRAAEMLSGSTASQGESFTVTPPTSAVPPGSISGTLTVTNLPTGTAQFKRAYLFAYDARNPPPTGQPVSVDEHEFAEFGGVVSSGLTVGYTLPALPSGNYLVTALVDTRGDFALDPQLFAAAPGEGTLLGGAAGVVPVTTVAVTGQAVQVSGASALPARPSFVLLDDSGAPVTADLGGLASNSTAPIHFDLHAKTILTPAISAIPEADPATFPLSWAACTSAGVPINDPATNLPAFKTQVLIVKLNATGSGPDVAADGSRTIIPASIDPLPFLNSKVPCAGALAVSDLPVAVTPAALSVGATGALTPLPQIPAGRYSIILVSQSGQIWSVPNQLVQESALVPLLATQGVALSVAAAPAPTGTIAGNLGLMGSYTSSTIGSVLLSAWSVTDPPPGIAQQKCAAPACGTGRPVASVLVPKSAMQALLNPAARFGYSLAVPLGSYFVTALMDVPGQFNPAISFMQTPPLGSQALLLGAGQSPTVVNVASGGSMPAQNDVLFDSIAAQQMVPVERPMFEFASSSPTVLLSGANSPIALVLRPPAQLPSLPYQPQPSAFHPFVVGAPGPLVHQGNTAGTPYLVTTQVVFTPLGDPAVQTCAPVGFVDPNSNSNGSTTLCAALFGTSAGPSGPGGCTMGSTGPALPPFDSKLTLSSLVVLVDDHLCVQGPSVLTQRPSSGAWRVTVFESLTNQAWSIPNEAGIASPGAGQGAFFTVQ